MTGSYMCDAHALAFNTLLSSQETDAFSGVSFRLSLCLNSRRRPSFCQIDQTRSICGNQSTPRFRDNPSNLPAHPSRCEIIPDDPEGSEVCRAPPEVPRTSSTA